MAADSREVVNLRFVGGVSEEPTINRGLKSLSLGFEVLYEEFVGSRAALQGDALESLGAFLDEFYEGRLSLDSGAVVAAQLHDLLLKELPAVDRLRTAEGGIQRLELGGDPAAFGLLSDLPWELTALEAEPAGPNTNGLFDSTLARLPVVRALEGDRPPKIPSGVSYPNHRLRVLYTIASPPASYTAQLNLEAFDQLFTRLVSGHPQVDWRPAEAEPERLHRQIETVAPHLFVVVAHGAADRRIDTAAPAPCLLMPGGWVALEAIGRSLAKAGTAMALLIACDTARRPSSILHSGAVTLVEAGVPEVLAMQGKISQEVARRFLASTLTGLLTGSSGCEAVAFGRRRISDSPHAFFPALYAAADAPTPGPVQKALALYVSRARELLTRFPVSGTYLPRAQPEERLAEYLGCSGLVHVNGGFGFGCSALVSHVLRRAFHAQDAPPPRPMLYVDLDAERDEMGLAKPPVEVVRERLDELEKLAATGDALALSSEELIDRIDRARVILVLDDLGRRESEDGREFWRAFLRQAKQRLKSSLVIAVRMPEDLEPMGTPTVEVGRFSSEETGAYLEEFADRLVPHTEKIHRLSDGVPALVAASSRDIGRTLKTLDDQRVEEAASSSMERYLESVRNMLEERHFEALSRLSWLRDATTADLALELVVPGYDQELADLVTIGVVRELTRDGSHWCLVSPVVADALRELYEDEIAEAAHGFARDFLEGVEARGSSATTEHEDELVITFQELVRTPGGPAILAAAQSVFYSFGERGAPLASAIPQMSYRAGAESEGLWRLFEAVADFADQEGTELPPDFLVLLAGLAESLGKHRETQRALEAIPWEGLSGYWRARALKTRAAFLKDTRQRDARDEIESCYEEAIEIAAQEPPEPEEGLTSEDWRSLLGGLLTNRLILQLFLGEGASVDGFDRDEATRTAERVRELAGDEEYANLLCILVEAERRRPAEAIDWEEVASDLAIAREILRDSGNHRYRAYWLYQEGRYHELRHDRFREALDFYQRSEEAAVAAGELRRQALARLRRIRLMRRRPELGEVEAREELDEMISRLSTEALDSLTLRVAAQIYSLRAEVEREIQGGRTGVFLESAFVALAHLPLDSESDRERLAQALVQYLRYARHHLPLVDVRRLLDRFRSRLNDKLGIEVSLDDPWRALDRLEASE